MTASKLVVIPPQFRSALRSWTQSQKPRLLFITHAWGGGVEQHISDLLTTIGDHCDVFILRGKGEQRVELDFGDSQAKNSHQLTVGGFNHDALPEWIAAFKALGFSRIHLHHIQGWERALLPFIDGLQRPVDVTLHDYYCVSPQFHLSAQSVRKDGAAQDDGNNHWPATDPAWQILFHPFLRRCERIIAPSQHVANGVQRTYPDLSITIQPHPEPEFVLPEIRKIGLLGGLSYGKGFAVACQVADLAAIQAPHLVFRLIGHSAEPLPKTITATGDYDARDLPRMLASERLDAIWLPSQLPETYGFTLSAALASGLPIVASAVGAFIERLQHVEHAKLYPADLSNEQWLAALVQAAPSTTTTSALNTDSASMQQYRALYLSPLQTAIGATGDSTFLEQLLEKSPAPHSEPDRPLLELLRIGAYAGHGPSIREAERRILMVPTDEAFVVGRRHAQQLEQEISAIQVRYDEEVERHLNNLEQTQSAISRLQQDAQHARQHIGHLEREKAELITERDRILGSASWRITRPLRLGMRLLRASPRIAKQSVRIVRTPSLIPRALQLYRRGGARALVNRLRSEISPTVGVIPTDLIADQVSQKLLTPPSAEVPATALHLLTSNVPTLSIVIPVYGQHPTTYNCLASIASFPPSMPYEVIVMDDCSPEPASDALQMVQGVHVIRNTHNLGFVGNMNAGAEKARGEWLVLLNNDTVVTAGAFDALLRTFDEHEQVGLVGAKLLNRDSTVQEAGGIIWQDGSGWNWGRNCDRRDPRFNFVREADYCSGAALAIRRDLFADMGGFDEHYKPAYYEDTDLAFRIRARGLRVLYQPAAEIYHLEGVSNGRDESTGIKAYQVTNGKKFFERWQEILAHHRPNAQEPELEAHRATRGNILVVEACMITPDQDSGSIRMLNLLRTLKREGYHVTFIADNLEYREKPVAELTQSGIEVLHNQWPGGVRKALRQRGPTLDAVIFCRHYIATPYIDSVRLLAPQARVIFDTVDLHFVREEREAKLLNNESMLRASATTRARELSIIEKSDVTLVVSEFEQKLLATIAPQARVEIVSNIHTLNPERPPFDTRSGILFVGGFRHPPNIDAMKWYATEVLPYLRKLLPGVITSVVGSNMTDEIRALQSDGLNIVGFIENLEPMLQSARVSIAPLRYGAGVKGKVNEAMNYGIPVVATACAVEGMHLVDGEEVLVADTPEAFAAAIARVYNDATLWQRLSVAGVNNVRQHFSPDAALPALRRMLG